MKKRQKLFLITFTLILLQILSLNMRSAVHLIQKILSKISDTTSQTILLLSFKEHQHTHLSFSR